MVLYPNGQQKHSRQKKTTSAEKPAKPACSHEWTAEETKLATCTNEGEITQTCTKCGKQKTEKTPKADHDYILTETTVGDCLHETTYTYTCTKCGDTNVQIGNLEPHAYIKTKNCVPDLCESDGYLEQECAVCGDVVSEVVPAHGHHYPEEKEVAKKPTCTESGTKAFICIHCQQLKDEEEIPATGHDTKTTVIEKPTFFKSGKEEVFCLNCKTVLEVNEVPATGGVWVTIIPIGVAILLGSSVGVFVYKKKKK